MQTNIPLLVCLLCFAGSLVAGGLDPGYIQQKWVKNHEKQANVPKPGDMLLNTQPAPALTEGFTDLFNGKDLDGWESIGGTCVFEARKGAIRGVCQPGSDSTCLCAKKADFADFIFTCELKWEVEGNTGVMFRAGRTTGKKGPTARGPQMEMEPFSQDHNLRNVELKKNANQ